MKGFETMPEKKQPSKPEKSKVVKERFWGGEAEAPELGKLIEAEIKAEEDLENFENTKEWRNYAEYINEAESEFKKKARENALKRLDEIEKLIDSAHEKHQKIIAHWRWALTKKIGNV